MTTPHGKSRRQRKAERRERLRALGLRKGGAPARDARWFLPEDEPTEFAICLQDRASDRAIHPSAAMRRMRASLVPLLAAGPGLFLILGDSAVGKSAFLRWIAQELARDGYRVVSGSCPLATLRQLADTLGGGDRRLATRPRLLRQALAGGDDRPPIVAVDDAELVSPTALLALLPLLDESDRSPARLRVILVGRPALGPRLEGADLARLGPHIRFRGRLTGFDESDAVALLRRRLGENGAAGDVAAALARHAEGRPEVVAVLCERATALAAHESTVCCSHVERAAALLRPARITAPKAADDAPVSAPMVPASLHQRSLRVAAGAMAAALVGLWLAASSFDVGRVAPAPGHAPQLAASQPIATPHPADVRSAPGVASEPPPSSPTIVARNAAPATDPGASTANSGALRPEKPAVPPPMVAAISPPDTIAAPPAQEAPPAIAKPVEAPRIAEAAPKPHLPPVENAASRAPVRRAPAPPKQAAAPAMVAKLESRPRDAVKEHPRAAPAVVAAASPRATPPEPQRDEGGGQVQLAAKPTQLASADPQCRPYVSMVNFAGRATNVSGVACRAPSGEWWLMDQRTE